MVGVVVVWEEGVRMGSWLCERVQKSLRGDVVVWVRGRGGEEWDVGVVAWEGVEVHV